MAISPEIGHPFLGHQNFIFSKMVWQSSNVNESNPTLGDFVHLSRKKCCNPIDKKKIDPLHLTRLSGWVEFSHGERGKSFELARVHHIPKPSKTYLNFTTQMNALWTINLVIDVKKRFLQRSTNSSVMCVQKIWRFPKMGVPLVVIPSIYK